MATGDQTAVGQTAAFGCAAILCCMSFGFIATLALIVGLFWLAVICGVVAIIIMVLCGSPNTKPHTYVVLPTCDVCGVGHRKQFHGDTHMHFQCDNRECKDIKSIPKP